MASTSICSFHTIFRFTVDVTKLSSEPIESSEVKLSNIDWKVKLEKSNENSNKLGIYLVSKLDENADNWSCEAQATFKLLPNDMDKMEQSIVKYLSKKKFSNYKRSHGFHEFVEWNEFLEHFVNEENVASFEVEISTEPSMRTIKRLGVDQKYAKFRVIVEDVSKLDACFSPETVVRGIRWKLLTRKKAENLSAFLWAENDDIGVDWSYKVEFSLELTSFDENIPSKKIKLTHRYRRETNDWGYDKFLSWTDFTDTKNNYVQNDRARFIVEMKVDEPEPQWKIGEYKLSKENSLLLCIVCLECFTSGNIFATKCGHLFCKPCFDKTIEQRQVCPKCNAPSSADEIRPIFFT